MIISYTGNNQKLIEAVDFIDELSVNEQFWAEIKNKAEFTYTNLTPAEIAGHLQAKDEAVSVKLYRPPFYRHRKTNAYVDARYPNTIFINSRKLWRNLASIVNTIVHEYVHVVDYTDHNQRIDYGHGNQSSVGKEDSAPYWIGTLAQRYFESEANDFSVVEEDGIDPDGIIYEEELGALN